MFCFNSFAQNKMLDSLWSVYKNKNQADTNRFKSVDIIISNYIGNNPDTAIVLAEEELKLAQSSGQKKYEANALKFLGVAFYYIGNF